MVFGALKMKINEVEKASWLSGWRDNNDILGGYAIMLLLVY